MILVHLLWVKSLEKPLRVSIPDLSIPCVVYSTICFSIEFLRLWNPLLKYYSLQKLRNIMKRFVPKLCPNMLEKMDNDTYLSGVF